MITLYNPRTAGDSPNNMKPTLQAPIKGTMKTETKTAKKAATKKAAPAKGGKPASKKTPAKKVAAKKPAPPAKKAVAPKPPVAHGGKGKKQDVATPKKAAKKAPAKKAPLVVTGHKAGSLPGDEIKHGVLKPREGTQARQLWGICDTLQKDLGRPPARFEFRQAVQKMKGTDGKSGVNPDSASFQYFAWRKFHGIKGRSIGIYPKRNTFEANVTEPKPAKVPKAPAKKAAKVAKPAAKKKTAPKPAPAKKAAKVAKKAAPAKKTVATSSAKPAKKAANAKKSTSGSAQSTGKSETPAPKVTVSEAPKVSSRAAQASAAARATGGVTVTPPTNP